MQIFFSNAFLTQEGLTCLKTLSVSKDTYNLGVFYFVR